MSECDKCNKNFNTNEGLTQHNEAKHKVEETHSRSIPVKKISSYGIFGVIILGLLYFGVVPIFTTSGGSDYIIQLEDENHIRGDPEAAITILEYSDFQCSSCKQATSIVKQVLDEYEGQVKLEYKHFPLSHINEFANKAAQASECAADQNMFWEYHDVLFDRQPALNDAKLKRYAEELGLDTELFNACLNSRIMKSRIDIDIDNGSSSGLRTTPTFFINGNMIQGAQLIETFRQQIDAVLA